MKINYRVKFIVFIFYLLCIIGLFDISLVQAANLGDAFSNTNYLPAVAESGAGYESGDVNAIIGMGIGIALSFLGVVFLVLMIYGGYLWMTARGNEQEAGRAKNLIVAAIIGLIIVLAAYAISYFVMRYLGGPALQ